MKITVISSGSKGNATLVETNKYNILIDAGISKKNAEARLNRDFPKIDILIITHIHTDHTKGLKSFLKNSDPIILTTSEEVSQLTSAKLTMQNILEKEDLKIELFPLSHDVPCTGIIITNNNKELVYITDTGYLKESTLTKISDKDCYIIESNHNIKKLMECSYPFSIKQRILGDNGHLSNETTAKYLEKIITTRTKNIILAHLSEENNTEELALQAMDKIMKSNPNITLEVAKQNECLETIEV